MEGNGGIQVVEATDLEEAIRERGAGPLPAALPVLPLKDAVAYPDTLTPLAVGQERSIKLIDDVLGGERTLVLVASRDPELDEPGPEQLHDVGVVGVVARMLKVPDGTMRILVQATERVRIADYVTEKPYLVARIEALPDAVEPSPELEALTRNVQRTFSRDHRADPVPAGGAPARGHQHRRPLGARAPDRRRAADPDRREAGAARGGRRGAAPAPALGAPRARARGDPARLADPVGGRVEDGEGPARVLPARAAEGDPARARRGGRDPGRGQRAARADRGRASCPRTRARPPTASSRRLERLPPAAAEYGVIRTYLEWLVDLPWSARTDDDLDLGHAREVLDADHYDLEKVKDRILEYLAVRSSEPGVARSDPLLRRARPGSARPASASRSPARSGVSSSGSRSAGSATRPRSAAIAAPTSARCRGRSSARFATRGRGTPCS